MSESFKENSGDTRPYWKVAVSLIFSLLATVLFIYLGYKLLIYFMPFAIGWALSSIAAPVVNWLEKRVKLKKKIGSALMILIVLAVIVFGIYFIASKLWEEIVYLSHDLPGMYRELENGLRHIADGMQGTTSKFPKGMQNVAQEIIGKMDQVAGDLVGKLSEPTVEAAGNIAKKIPSIFVSLIVTIVSAYFFISDKEQVLTFAKQIMPKAIVSRMTLVSDNFKYAIGGYFKAQSKIMTVVFAILLIGFGIMGIHFSILLAIAIAMLDFLPFFGTGTALIPWGIYKFLMGDYKMMIGLAVLYAVTQLVRQVIQPKLVGDSIGLNPLLTLVFLYIGYKSGGLFGMIFAVPVGLIILNLIKAGAFDYLINDMKILIEGIYR